ncbi:MAG: aminotransferase [Anaerolineaceae bacterium]|nr:aminotransferase [Anaerolineaceae bacterium]
MTYARRVSSFGTTIFTEINNLAREHQAVNLGQGMPDFDGPREVIEAAAQALLSGEANQYAPGPGIPALRQGVAHHAKAFYNMDIDPQNGVLVTPGATEAVFCSIMGLVDPGDEVIIIEPFFDSYPPGVIMANARPVYVPLHPPEWTFDPDELRAAFNDKTRAIVVNTPNNPTGRVFTRDELTLIADLCKEFDVLVISDEVYEHLIYDNARHIPIATLPDMFERTVTIGSAGKTFGMTGWKVGWVYGPPELVTGVWRSHQFTTFATNHPAQKAVAHAFTMGSNYYEEYQALYTQKRDLMMQALDAAGLKSITPQGTYFVMADFSDVFDGDDVAFTKHLITEIGVACIPPSAFFSADHRYLTKDHVRFAFCKSDDTLKAAGERMAKLRG